MHSRSDEVIKVFFFLFGTHCSSACLILFYLSLLFPAFKSLSYKSVNLKRWFPLSCFFISSYATPRCEQHATPTVSESEEEITNCLESNLVENV